MSKEHLSHKHPETAKHHDSAEHKAHSERIKAHHEREAAKETKTVNVAELEQQANQEAQKASEAFPATEERQPDDSGHLVRRELKDETLKRTLKQVRTKLSAPSRAFSRVVHQPAVDAVSQAASKTVARPSGFLGGSILAFVGSSAFLWVARHYGFSYNYLIFVLFFAGGFVIGMFLELLWFAVRRKKA